MVRDDRVRVADETRVHPFPQKAQRPHDGIDLSRQPVRLGGIHHQPRRDVEHADEDVRDVGAERDEQARQRLPLRAPCVDPDAVLPSLFPEHGVDQEEIEDRRECAGKERQPGPLALRRGGGQHQHDPEKGRAELVQRHLADIFPVLVPEFLHVRSRKNEKTENAARPLCSAALRSGLRFPLALFYLFSP